MRRITKFDSKKIFTKQFTKSYFSKPIFSKLLFKRFYSDGKKENENKINSISKSNQNQINFGNEK